MSIVLLSGVLSSQSSDRSSNLNKCMEYCEISPFLNSGSSHLVKKLVAPILEISKFLGAVGTEI